MRSCAPTTAQLGRVTLLKPWRSLKRPLCFFLRIHNRLVACSDAPASKMCRTSDWEARPLSPAQVAYAALDAHALVRIYDAIAAQLGREALQALCRSRSGSGALANGNGSTSRGGSNGSDAALGGRLRVSAGLSGADEETGWYKAGSADGSTGGGDGRNAAADVGFRHNPNLVQLPARCHAAGSAQTSSMKAAGARGASMPSWQAGAMFGGPRKAGLHLRASGRACGFMGRSRGFGHAASAATLVLPCSIL